MTLFRLLMHLAWYPVASNDPNVMLQRKLLCSNPET